MSIPTNPDPRRIAAGLTAREIVDELVRRIGFAEVQRQTGVPVSTEDELRAWADECDRELAR